MIRELTELASEFDVLDQITTPIYVEWMHSRGVTDEQISQELDRLIQGRWSFLRSLVDLDHSEVLDRSWLARWRDDK